MKKIIQFFCSLSFILILSSCSQRSSDVGQSSQTELSYYNDLADYLRKKTNLQVNGVGDDVKIIVRGISTFSLETQPLFIVNGVNMGHSYKMANQAIDPSMIENVRVLKGKSQTAVYGEDGVNGVILVKTK